MTTDVDQATDHGSGDTRSAVRIVLYYVVLLVAAGLVVWRFPVVEQSFALGSSLEPGIGSEVRATFGQDGGLSGAIPAGWHGMLLAAVSLLGALAVMLPVTWTYIHIKRRAGYDESVVHALLILPIAVTGIVLIVKESLALAFSLAGIVAAVRFRTTLKDTKDAVYIFLAIGVGLAAGVQALGVAVVLSLVFSGINLALWQINFGNIYTDKDLWAGGRTLGDAVAGLGSKGSSLSIGDTRLLAALSPTELQEVATRMGRMDRYLKGESSDRKERKRYSVLMIYTPTVAAAQALVEPHLDELCVRWSLAEVVAAGDDLSVIEYLVRLADDIPAGRLLDQIRDSGGPAVKAAELRSLKGLANQNA